MDLFVVPTIGFDLLYTFVIVRLARRDLVCTNVTAKPTAEWIARQIRATVPSSHGRFSVDFITNMVESDFRYTQVLNGLCSYCEHLSET